MIAGAYTETIGTSIRQGAVYVFAHNDAGSWEPVERLVASDGLSSANFGSAVALDGDTRLVGANGHAGRRGAVYLHTPAPSPVEPEGCQPASTPGVALGDGSVVRDDSGVVIGTVPGTLPGSLSIWIDAVPAPAEALFSNATPAGDYYNFGADCTTFAPQDTPFVIGLPVPEGIDSSNLAVAVRIPADDVLDGPESGAVWQPLAGYYDNKNRLYFVTAAALLEQGSTYVLVEHPDLGPLPVPDPVATAAVRDDTAPSFLVECIGFAGSGCGVTETANVQKELLDAYVIFHEEGFLAPALSKMSGYLTEGGFTVRLFDNPWHARIHIRPQLSDECAHIGGKYARSQEAITICLDEGGTTDVELRHTVRHELFHAVQAAYPEIRGTRVQRLLGTSLTEEWVMEGTAEAAVESDAEMRRTWGEGGLCRRLRRIDVPLQSETGEPGTLESLYPYQAQDFWVLSVPGRCA